MANQHGAVPRFICLWDKYIDLMEVADVGKAKMAKESPRLKILISYCFQSLMPFFDTLHLYCY